MMAHSTCDIDEEPWVVVNIAHRLIQSTATSDQLSTSLEIFACLSLLLRLVSHVRVLSWVKGPISHLPDKLADFRLALYDFKCGLLVPQREFLELICGHYRVLATELGGHGE